MKRSGPIQRHTPLKSSKPIERTTAWPAPVTARSQLHANSAIQRQRPKAKRRNTGPTTRVRNLVKARSDGWCEWFTCFRAATDVHHRLNRKAGGRHGEMADRINQPAWLLHACREHHAAVTSPVGAALELALDSGWLLREGDDARSMPVVTRHGRVWLTDDGLVLTSNPAEEARP